ncbi:MAG: DUF1232 domain-containing protein [Ignavibacteriaceae bacterium]|nr:DUF1232 domain-containing protein [Ignavibacteriaceae bacterium]
MKDDDIDLDEFTELDFGSIKEDKDKILFVEENIWSRLEKSGKKVSFARDLLALYRYMDDPNVSWQKKVVIAAALIYFVTPIDKIPKFTRFFGLLDELGVMTILLKFLGKELVPYYEEGYRAD